MTSRKLVPPTGLEPFFHGKPPKLWSVGDTAILDRRLLGIISARRIDTDLALRSSQLLKQLAFLEDVAFISGWHSPMEDEALRILSANSVRIVFCLSKALNRFIPSLQVKNEINDGRVLLLTHCSLKAKRISRDASLRRTHLVVGLAATVLVLSAPEGVLRWSWQDQRCAKEIEQAAVGVRRVICDVGKNRRVFAVEKYGSNEDA